VSFSIAQEHDHHHDHTHNHHHHHHSIGVIRGSVLDSMLDEIKVYANISIVKEGTEDIIAGGISDENGMFLIDQIPFGKYYVVVEYIGYEDMIVEEIIIRPPDKLQIDLGPIYISPKMIMLDGVSVIDKAAPIIEDIAKTTYPVAETSRSEGGTAEEVLEKIPSVSINENGNISLRGNENVTILINGRKSQMSVKALNANMIEKIEVMTTPSAKYDPDGMAGIINIVLSKNEFVGRSGFITFNNSGFEDYSDSFVDGGQNIAGTFNSFKNNWNLFTNYSISNKYKQSRGERSTTYTNLLDETSTNNSSIETADKYPNNKNFKSGIEYYPNDKSLIAFDITYIEYDNNDTTINITNEEDIMIDRKTIEIDNGNDLNYGFGYFWDDSNAKKSFSFQMDYDDHQNDKIIKSSIYNDENIQDYVLSLNESVKDDGNEYIYSIDYSSPIINQYNENAKYELGVKVQTEDQTHYANVQEQDFNWNYDNMIAAGYFNILYNFTEKFGIQVGTRLENQDKESSITYESNFTCNQGDIECELFKDIISLNPIVPIIYEHNRVYPSLYFLYDTQGKGNYKFELGRRIERPGHWSLDPIPDLEDMDSGFIRQGNPFLKPENIYKSEISYSNRLPIGFLKASIYYSSVTDKIDRDKDTYCFGSTCNNEGDDSDQNNYMILSWDNVSKSEDRGIDFTFMTRPLPNWDLMINGNYWNNILDGIESDQQGSEYGFWGMMNSTIKLKNNQQIGIFSHFSSPRILSSGEIKGMSRIDLSYKKKVNNRLNFTVKLKDVFDKSGFKITTDQLIDSDGDGSYNQREFLIADHRRGKRTLSFNLEYRFGDFQKKKYRREAGHGHSHGGEGMDVGY
tara:strand:+ start:1009 stop:3570 length:2562 start_codon:yes stop_codon:yes gene_type:complete